MAFLLSFDDDSPADPRLVRPPSAHLVEAVAGCCRSGCDMRPRDQPPQHWREIWRLIERMSTEDFRAFFIQGAEGLMHLRCGFPHLAYSFADEQQILGIDVACLYEATRLLGTPAGVRLIHQSALVVHKVTQVSVRAGQALSKVVGSDLQHLSSNGVAYSKIAPRIKVKRCSRSRQRSIPEVQESISSVTSRSASADVTLRSANSKSGVASSAAP